MKLLSFAIILVGFLDERAFADTVTVRNIGKDVVVVISMENEGTENRRSLQTNPGGGGGGGGGTGDSTVESVVYDPNPSTNSETCLDDGGVCGSGFRCFEGAGPENSYLFENPSQESVCKVDLTFYHISCGDLTNMPVKINDLALGSVTGFVDDCNCGKCYTKTISTTDPDVLNSINVKGIGEGNTVAWEINPGAPTSLCLDKLVIDLHTCGSSGTNGDPHFKTWKNEHYEYHGQCDLVVAKDPEFANGLGLDVQIRTKLVRFWSYIKQVAIRIGDDILEVQGSGEPTKETNYWINFEYRGPLETIGGFPVTNAIQNDIKHHITIDLSSKYPNQRIHITTLKEFVRVDFENGTPESFGNTVGLMGNFRTGKTLARDGATILNDFGELGREWQVLPTEYMLFHNVEEPQFPKSCLEPEDPQGERRRRLSESTISQEQAEAACASLKDPLDRKDCIYDILATQDLDMVGAF